PDPAPCSGDDRHLVVQSAHVDRPRVRRWRARARHASLDTCVRNLQPGPVMDPIEARLQRLEDLLAINQLFIDYGEHLDAGDFDAYAARFADDGEVMFGPMGRATGRAEIRALMAGMLADRVGSTFHIVSSPRIDLRGDTAT